MEPPIEITLVGNPERITELENQLEKMEERHAIGTLDKDLYEKYSFKYRDEISKIRQEMAGSLFDRSNFNLTIEKGIKIAEKLSQVWVQQVSLQSKSYKILVSPKGILYKKKKADIEPMR